MQTNALPHYDDTDNPTGCCPRFNPKGWDGQHLHFEDKDFVRAVTRSDNHVPIDMDQVFQKTFGAIMQAGAHDPNNTIVLSRDVSPSQGEHLFAVSKPVPGEEMVKLTGDYLTKVFEGPYEKQPQWQNQFHAEIEAQGKHVGKSYMFYTTCPTCAATYGKNYVVGVAELTD